MGLYVAFVVLLQLPTTQRFLGEKVSEAIGEKLGTDVRVGRVNLGLLNRIIVDNVQIDDQQHLPMLSAARVSAKVDLLSLTQGRIVITSAQLFGLKAALYQEQPDADFNFQFALDSLASKDTTKHTPLDLKINSLVVRHGQIAFDKKYIAPQSGVFSPAHIHASDISGHVILNALKDDSLNLNLKRLSFKEASGINVKSLQLKAVANKSQANLDNFILTLPASQLNIGHIGATYRFENDKLQLATLQYEGGIDNSYVTLSELAPFIPSLKDNNNTLSLLSTFSGTSTNLRVSQLDVNTADGSLALRADGSISDWQAKPRWNGNIEKLHASTVGLQTVLSALNSHSELPQEVVRLGDIDFSGTLGGVGKDVAIKGLFNTEAGDMLIALGKNGQQFTGHLTTEGINLRQILDNEHFGMVDADIDLDGILPRQGKPSLKAEGRIGRLDYNDYAYRNIEINGTYRNGLIDGQASLDDPNAKLTLWGTASTEPSHQLANITAEVKAFNPKGLKISDKWGDATFSFDLTADVKGKSLRTVDGSVNISQFMMDDGDNSFAFDNMLLLASAKDGRQRLSVESDFANVEVEGQYDYKTLLQSITNTIGSRLPTLPGLPKTTTGNVRNDFTLSADISNSDFIRHFFDIPLTLHEPIVINGELDDYDQLLQLHATLPHFTYDEKEYRGGLLDITTQDDTLRTHANIQRIGEGNNRLTLELDAAAADNHLGTSLLFDSQTRQPIRGQLNADAQFFKTDDNKDAAHVDIHSSEIVVGDSIWTVEPGTIVYSKNNVTIDHLAVKHGAQHIFIDGHATTLPSDTLIAELKDVDVKYILDLVNFHSVDFSGKATGKAVLTQAFQKPEASANLVVDGFRFQNGRMGVLTANARLNNELNQIDIDAVANDNLFSLDSPGFDFLHREQHELSVPFSYTTVKGFVSPQRNDIELFIGAHHTRGEFLQTFCESFMRDVNVCVDGDLRLYGPLSDINLTGDAVANGTLGIKPLNTSYTLRNDTIRLIPDEIMFMQDTIYDAREHIGIVTGALHHKSLTNLSYDIGVQAQDLLAFDVHDFGDDTFCGTVYGTGNCTIRGRSGEVTIDVDVTPEKDSEIRYNAASPDAISNSEFITWNDRNATDTTTLVTHVALPSKEKDEEVDIPTDIRLNFNINATPDATLKVIMDQQSGDYIALNGNGAIRATYYNKGTFDMFGNYNVDHGIYKLTIQNVIKKDFQFQEGSTIAFGGDPFHAALNLKAQYTVAGVPLSDLNIGRSFSSNNIRVNCLMNISGTPGQPRVDFELDLPTIGTDAKQMIFSLINSEEEMNQQVLYLLAVGRFYNQGANNAGEGPAQQSQTSLAMQSLLSGTISQQLNNVLSSVVKNQNWNFGANISTGDQGFYNAEYEGLLSGRLLNNRLLINGEFGYRDNPNATSSFIGDFDIRYLLRPNGNLSIKVYNQTNDRYFTRNSLNTQGIGLLMKKDFNGLSDLFGIKQKKAAAPVDTLIKEPAK